MKKRWHFKRWFQHVVEVFTAACMVILLGIDSFTGSFAQSILVVVLLAGGFIGGVLALEAYGVYK